RQLLTHYGISKPLRSHHQFSEATQLASIITELEADKHLALVSDRGTPGIADPGARLIAAVIAHPDLTLEVLPGPTAITTALLLGGFGEDPFLFLGFLPRKRGDRQAALAPLKGAAVTAVIYEAPTRVLATLADAAEALGPDRPAAVAKELTKLHERIFRGALGDLPGRIPAEALRGEFVVLIGPDPNPQAAPEGAALDPAELAAMLVEAGLRAKEARAMLAKIAGIPPSRAYDLLVEAQRHAHPAAP
ncbi:MAG TPA: ribosomal RNA small subunit methyltransferase I, partial [bacterium]|nr:ribosomal RNA small subunit methyltransferase I [bacterium]